mmetsp:Transcript_36089/g.88826  ORF Transcript_36089/g.88826 Transcript_36089/m.88826 type:complete len:213 (-) Transcript_36089:57-695(-)
MRDLTRGMTTGMSMCAFVSSARRCSSSCSALKSSLRSSKRKPTPLAIVWHVSPLKNMSFLLVHTCRNRRSSACTKSCVSSTIILCIGVPWYDSRCLARRCHRLCTRSAMSYAPRRRFSASYISKSSYTRSRFPRRSPGRSSTFSLEDSPWKLGAILAGRRRYSSRESLPSFLSRERCDPLMKLCISWKTALADSVLAWLCAAMSLGHMSSKK